MRLMLLLAVFAVFGVEAQSPADALRGKCGEDLKTTIARMSRPVRLPGSYTEAGGAWEAFRTTDNRNGCVLDRYSTHSEPFTADGISPSAGMGNDQIVNIRWWGDENRYGDTIKYDLHHLIPCNSEVAQHKRDYPPGEVTAATYDNGTWQAGLGIIAGYSVNVYCPAEEYRGDFARAIMYVATLYPAQRWNGASHGVNFFTNTVYPTLNQYAKRLLLAWHRSDPVSDEERLRNDAVEKIQGNRNVFIDYPTAAEHIWGEMADTPFDTTEEPVPLRSTYRLGDKRIDLYHASITDGAVWSVNGRSITASYLIPAELGTGLHELRYETSNRKGKVMIRIVE